MAAVGEVLAQHAAPGVGPGAFRAGGQPAIVALSWENGLLAQRSDHSWHWLLRDQHLEVLAATQRALYVGTDSGHVWRSGDGGLHWRRADTGLPKSLCPLANDSEACWLVSRSSVVVDALIADPHAPDTLYCSTGIPRLLYRTTDGGATWQWLPIASGLPFIETLVVDLHDSRSLWAGTVESGLYHSGDAGRTWSLMHLGIAGVPDNQAWVETIELLPWQRNTVYAQATLKLSASQYRSTWYRSTDGGQHWTSAASPVAPGQELTSLTISSHAPYWAYARVGNGNAYVSTDGQHWRHSQYVDGIIVADPMQPRTAYSVGGNGIMRSTDGGRTWRRYSSGIAQASDGLRTAVFAPSI